MKILFLWYLRTLARAQLYKIKPTIVGVGGASGKSSLAGLISLILKTKYTVLESKGKNSETGIPLTVLGVNPGQYSYLDWLKIAFVAPFKLITDWHKYDFFIAEMGIDGPSEPKNMSYLLSIVKPKVGVLTNIAVEHAEYFDFMVSDKEKRKEKILDLIAEQEGLLLKSLPKDGLAILNTDDSLIGKIKVRAEKITVSSKNSSSTFFIKKITTNLTSFKVDFIYNKEFYSIKIQIPLPSYYAYTLIDSIAVSTRFGINASNSIRVLEKEFSLPPGRFSVFKGIKNTTILDSSYNSSPSAISEALNLLSFIAKGRRRVGIIGDMRELGKISSEEHKILGNILIKTTDFAILIGPQTSEYTSKVLEKAKHPYLSFPDFYSAKKTIAENIREKDIVLVKSSQNTLFLERAVEMLLFDSKDVSKLPRRGKFWDKKRREAK